MKCPACDRTLEQVTVSDVAVDICRRGCGGIWFDRFELQKFDEPHEEAGRQLLETETDSSIKIDRTRRLHCPKCEDPVMMRHFFSMKQEVEVDECPGCAGFWLDVGELRHVRSLFSTEADRKAAAARYFQEVVGERLDAMRDEGAEKMAKARDIANLFRFVCPSYYIPGKQKWGAF